MAFGYLSFHIFTKSFIKKTLTKEFYSSLNTGLTFARWKNLVVVVKIHFFILPGESSP